MKRKSKLQFLHYIILIGFYIITGFFIRSYFSDPVGLLSSLKEVYRSYGYQILFLAGLIEGTFLLSTYIPGTAIILTGAVFAKTGETFLPFVILAGASGLVVGYVIDYILGKYGWYTILTSFGLLHHVENAKSKLERYEKRSLFLGLSSPFFATFLSTAAGMLGIPFKRFFLLVTIMQFFWTTVYASIAYVFGMVIVEFFLRYLGVLITLFLVGWAIKVYFKRKSHS